ncbi:MULTISPECIES: LysR family transcriptional regulator [unclassified Achromobacter]|uniref:LysR family transcriptional regulator n=1 Tax=unclassified Achromobacter TaxID=2626865 RepID=UPI000B51A108|nr:MULTISPECIES: LysR family transcriptional regulator [unclassified Achromobacter]OWT75000.1 LysR family transcriptional regulator [Achromobacter sp. HZ28]OWT76609.1 LysR family transcriptional regulator [Achromobacter sp. HZ34]
MNQREMALFEAVARTGSVTLAAAATRMSQPAASAMLKALEDKLGFALFTRDKRRLALTAEARLLLPEIVNALAAMDTAERMAASMRGGTHARLVVGAVAAVGASILPGAMAWLQEQEPGIRVAVRTDMTLGVVELAADQRIDIGIIIGAAALPNVGQRSLAQLGIRAVMLPDHPYASRRSLTLADFEHCPYISLSRHLQVGALTARQFEAARLPFMPTIEVNQYSAACAFAERGLGVAILDSMSGIYAQRHGLCVLPIEIEGSLSLDIVWPLNRGLGRAARQLEAGLLRELEHAPSH